MSKEIKEKETYLLINNKEIGAKHWLTPVTGWKVNGVKQDTFIMIIRIGEKNIEAYTVNESFDLYKDFTFSLDDVIEVPYSTEENTLPAWKEREEE